MKENVNNSTTYPKRWINTHCVGAANGEEDNANQRIPQNGKSRKYTQGYESDLAEQRWNASCFFSIIKKKDEHVIQSNYPTDLHTW